MATSVSYEEFTRLDIRVCKVLEAERIEGRRKLLKLKVDIGDGVRTLVAGAAEYYEPNYFVGRSLVMIANLQPRTIAGVTSEGMLLAADVGGKPVWLTVDGEAPPGSRVR